MRLKLSRWIGAAAMALALAAPALAVSPVGAEIRVDVDPNTSFYAIGRHYVARTGSGGFAVLWESDTQNNGTFNFEAIRHRVFKPNRKPAGGPRSLDVSGLRPLIAAVSIVPLGSSKVYAVFTGPDATTGEELAYGQAISIANGSAAARRLLCKIEVGTTIAARLAALADGRAVFACFGFFNPADYSDIPGRFIATSGKPGAANLQFALDEESQLSSLQTFGSGVLAYYPRASIFSSTFDTFGRVFKSNGTPLGPAKKLPKAPDMFHLTNMLALSNNRILARRYEKVGAQYRLTGQAFSQTWKSVVAKKTLIQQTGQYPVAAAFPLPDGGFLLWQRTGTGADAEHAILQFDAQLKKVGATFAFKAIEGDIGRAVAVDSGHSMLIYRKKVAGRERLVGQLVNN